MSDFPSIIAGLTFAGTCLGLLVKIAYTVGQLAGQIKAWQHETDETLKDHEKRLKRIEGNHYENVA